MWSTAGVSDGLEPDGLHAGHVHGRSPRGAVVRPARVLREGDTVGPDGEIQRDPHTEEDGEGNNRSVSTGRAAVCRLMVFGFCRSRNLGTGEWQMQATVVGQ